ncbi:major capsid protein [Dipodfec virus UOA04_Rod_742]|nr:major capsid protein [Dipodfec virus UOA04_Rod_742]
MANMVNQFSSVPTVSFYRNSFVRNSTFKATFDSGYLIPFFWDEVLPGDTKRLNSTMFGRLSTPFVPFLDNVYLDTFYFFVPNRLVWDNWQKFMGERKNPKDSIDYLVPTITAGSNGFKRGGLLDYLSVPPSVANLKASSLTFYLRSYNLIWNEWFRDENLQDSVDVPTGDGPDTEDMYPILKRGKRQDYFTSALPQPQKGPGVELPLGGTAPVQVFGNGKALGLYNGEQFGGLGQVSNTSGLRPVADLYNHNVNPAGGDGSPNLVHGIIGVTSDSTKSGLTGIADLTQATAATINSLRQAIALQQFLEADARGGTRYIELLLSHFGVQSPDYRLQRPEYLGGGSTRLNVYPIAQTSSSDATSPQGNIAGYATFGATGNGFTKSFTEHGIILGLCCVRADLTYQDGLDRHFSRNTRYDYYWPRLAHLGEQEIKNKEIYAQGNAQDDEIFGYQERYGEYRYKNSTISGKFRSSDPQSLDIWHLAQKFDSLPTLSSQFIEENPPLKRVLAVQNEPEILLDVFNELDDIREIPLYGVPGLERI